MRSVRQTLEDKSKDEALKEITAKFPHEQSQYQPKEVELNDV